MKAVIVECVGKLYVKEVERPVLLPDEVLVEVAACGVCGSDIRYLHGDNPWASQTLGTKKPNPPNMALGHEFSGTVVETGSPRHERLVGKRVAALAYRGCHRCHYCLSGRHHLCGEVEHIGHAAGWEEGQLNPGGMADACRVWAEMAYPLPDEITSEQGCLLDGVAVAVHACDQGRVARGDHVMIVGSGAVGLLILQVARLSGASFIMCIDTCRKPVDVARGLGADECQLIQSASECEPRHDQFDVVFDTVGSAETVTESMLLLRRGGRAVLMAHPADTLPLDSRLFSGERTLMTSANSPYPDFAEAIELVASGRVRVAPLITHHFPLDEAVQAFAVAEDKDEHGSIKVLIEP